MPEAERLWSGRLKYQEAKVAYDGQVQEKAEHHRRGHADSRAESDVPHVCSLHDARAVSHMTSIADGRLTR